MNIEQLASCSMQLKHVLSGGRRLSTVPWDSCRISACKPGPLFSNRGFGFQKIRAFESLKY